MPSFDDVLPKAGGDAATDAVADAADDVAAPADGDQEGGALVGCDDPSALAIWPLTEGSGTKVHDCAGKFPGVFMGSVSWAQGRGGLPALDFSGGSVRFMDVQALRLSGPFTVTAWVSPRNTQTDVFGDVICRYRAGGEGVWALAVTKDPLIELNVFAGNITQVTGGVAFTWAHTAATYDPGSGKMEIYVSGNLKSSITGPTMPTQSTVPLTFGANSDGTSIFHGGLSQVRLYDRVLSSSEIGALAQK